METLKGQTMNEQKVFRAGSLEVPYTVLSATQVVHWPGKDIPACEEHLKKLIGLASVLGFQLSWTSCEPTVCSNCESEAKR
jgi:hypothetical protein